MPGRREKVYRRNFFAELKFDGQAKDLGKRELSTLKSGDYNLGRLGDSHKISRGSIMPALTELSGIRYLRESNLDRGMDHRRQPPTENGRSFKSYPRAQKIPLSFDPGRERDFWKLLRERRAKRDYGSGLVSREELAALLWAAQGVTSQGVDSPRRTAPSAGALYPLETYVVLEKTEDLARGLYHLDVHGFQLEWLSAEPYGREIAHAALEQNFLAEAAVIFLWSAVFRRNMRKYGQRGLRYIFFDAGHVCQNLLLAAEALGLAACPVAAFYDDELNDLLLLDGEEESVLYLAAVGRK
jgi:SagB-type dehydrogenase family enzyme